jgi:hypothetical protein
MADERLGPPFSIGGWGVWPPQAPEDGALPTVAVDPRAEAPPAALLGPRVRGRASQLTLMFAEVLGQACSARPEILASVPTIYGSAYGEMERLVELLGPMQREDGEISPLRFQTSVHNAAAGLISIATGDRAFSTSIAAGAETVAMAFLEAVGWLAAQGGEIVVVVGDEPCPPALVPEDGRFGALAAAFLLRAEPAATPDSAPASRSAPPAAARCQLLRRPGTGPAGPGRRGAARHPCAAVVPLVRTLRAGALATVPLDTTGFSRYFVEVSCPASKT